MTLQPGTVIAGRYEVVKCLGAGNMGLVYACRHRELSGHMVAIKVLFPEVAQDKIAAQRFRNEIFAAYGVSHPNVVRAYEYLRDGDLVAYTMEYVGGGDLAERLGHKPLMPVNEAISILCQICSGVQAIHDAGIVHRDLKPENILLTKEGMVKIADFGIARVGHGSKLTEHGGVVGTIDYVAPEYMLNSQVDWRSDIYAIGILGYEMLTGSSPFRGDSVYATMTKRLKADAPPPSSLRSEIPPALDAVIKKALERDPARRYQSAAEMFGELEALLPDRNIISQATRLQMNRSISGAAFVGPVYTTATGEEIKEEHENEREEIRVDQAQARLKTAPTGNVEFPASVQSACEGYERGADMQATVAIPTVGRHGTVLASEPFVSLAIKTPRGVQESGCMETIDIASQYHFARNEVAPMKKDKSAACGGILSNGGEQMLPTQVIINAGGIDQNRMRRLSEMVDKEGPSLWLEVVTLMVAIIFGVGVGFFVVRLIFPGLMEGNRERVVVGVPESKVETGHIESGNGDGSGDQ